MVRKRSIEPKKKPKLSGFSSTSTTKVSPRPLLLGVYPNKKTATRAKSNTLGVIRRSARSLSIKPGVIKKTHVLSINPAVPK